jgi:S-(hydroxymethyl)glutathione dehydrogenase/alcohol dehydrogenase
MRAAIMRAVGEPLTIEDVDVDRPAEFEVLIDVAAAGLCHSDVHFMTGAYPTRPPAVMGHESAGVVSAVGERVTHVRPGDHVITCLSMFCGTCDECLSGHPNRCSNRAASRRPGDAPPRLSIGGEPLTQLFDLGSYAEQILVAENAVVKVRSDAPLGTAVLLGCGVTTGLGAVFNTAGVRPGETMAVIGCGGIGLGAVQGGRIAGANRIIAIDRVASKLETARQLGATDTVETTSVDDVVAAVKELTAGGVHHAFEAIGLASTAAQAFQMLRRGGTATVLGMIPLGEQVSVHGFDLLMEKRLQGSDMGSNRFRIDIPRYLDMYMDGRLQLDEMVSNRIPIDDINQGFDQMLSGAIARNVITFD